MKLALGVIDYQFDFADPKGKLYVLGGEKLKATIGHLLLLARQKGTMVFHSCDQHDNPDPEFEKWPAHCIAGTEGAKFIFGIGSTDVVIAKGSFEYSAFAPRTKNPGGGRNYSKLGKILKKEKIDTLILTGLAYDFCVRATAIGAALLKFKVFVVEDCTATVSEENAVKARAELEKFGVKHISFLEAAKMLGSID